MTKSHPNTQAHVGVFYKYCEYQCSHLSSGYCPDWTPAPAHLQRLGVALYDLAPALHEWSKRGAAALAGVEHRAVLQLTWSQYSEHSEYRSSSAD